ncbi:MAG: hypothetical protein U0744_01075 [Gemmataceae bacterium]
MMLPKNWPFPLVVQEFIRLNDPQVFRIYAAGGSLFGWNVRRFPSGAKRSPWVAHARGARYEFPPSAPAEAETAARSALEATGLLDSFGCADLLCSAEGEWLVLEVGTDGMFNHVDRALENSAREREILEKIAGAFWNGVEGPPWGKGAWSRSSEVQGNGCSSAKA